MDRKYENLKKEARYLGISLNMIEGGKKRLATGRGYLSFDTLDRVAESLRSGEALVRLVPLIEEPYALDDWTMMYWSGHAYLFMDKDEDTGKDQYFVEFDFYKDHSHYLLTYDEVHCALACGKMGRLLEREKI